jgi:hypothetical protein
MCRRPTTRRCSIAISKSDPFTFAGSITQSFTITSSAISF